jgi:GDP-L-fucose synthase
MSKNQNIFIAGHKGMVGSAIMRALQRDGYTNIVTRGRAELDLVQQSEVRKFFAEQQVDQVYIAAARVGGIYANNTYPAEFIYENLMVEANLVHEAWRAGVKKILFLGSSCIYPKHSPQPMKEDMLLTGILEPTNEPYAIAKITGIKLCESYNRQYGTDYRSVMPTNLYGQGDNYHAENSHVIPGLIRRFHEAKQAASPQVVIWGTGAPMREFLYVDDMAAASVHVMELDPESYARHTQPRLSHINIGTGQDITIKELAELIGQVVGYAGRITFDVSKPDGAMRKLMDVGRMESLGWQPRVRLSDGLELAYRDFLTRTSR